MMLDRKYFHAVANKLTQTNRLKSAILQRLSIAGLLLILIGCTHHVPISKQVGADNTLPQLNDNLFSLPRSVVSPKKITQLNPQQTAHFLNYFHAPVNQNTVPHERVANYLGIVLESFQYSEKTLTAEQALLANSGNCLSLVLVTDAIAKLSGVNVEYQLLEQNPVYSIDQDLLIRSDHMRSVVYSPWTMSAEGGFKFKRSTRIDYFQTDGLSYVGRIPHTDKNAMYFSNVAVEFATEKEYDHAFAYAKKALSINPKSLSAINTLGLLHRRLGDSTTAEALYRYGFQLHPDKAIFLRNLSTILKSEARFDELSIVQQEIKRVDSNRLVEFIRTGREADRVKDYHNAVLNYQRALAIAPDLHELHFYSAVAQYKMGANDDAKTHFHRAIKEAANDSTRSLYERKLAALQTRKLLNLR